MNALQNTSSISLLFHEVLAEGEKSGFQNNDNLPYIHNIQQFNEAVSLANEQALMRQLIEEIDFSVPQEQLLFTFDDGGISALQSAQLLENKGFKGHYFITTHCLNQPFFMTDKDLHTLAEQGHSIGSHSHTHPMIFRSLSYNKMLQEWQTSRKILEDTLGKPILTCSIPGGDADEKTYDSAIESGFKFIFNSEPTSKVYKKEGALIIGRFSVKNTTSLVTIEQMLTHANHAQLQRNRKIKNTIKKLIFPLHSLMQNRKNIQ